MGMGTDTRTLTVERSTSTAHRLHHYDGVCGNVHGHNMAWDIELLVSMEAAGDDNMPLDFKDVSDLIDQYDHAILLNISDPLFPSLGVGFTEDTEFPYRTEIDGLGDTIIFESDPTCELVAQVVADQLTSELEPVLLATVTLHETEKYGMTAESVGNE